MQAIVTTFTPDPDHRAAIVAACMGKSVRVPYDQSLSLDDNHVQAAQRLAHSLGWLRFDWTFGRLPLGDYCHVAVEALSTYTTVPGDGIASPPEYWRGRGAGSTARALLK